MRKKNRLLFLLLALVMLISVGKAEVPEQYREELADTVEAVEFYRGTRPMLTLMMFSDLHEDPEVWEPKTLDDMLSCMAALIPEIQPDAIFNLGDLIYGERYTLSQGISQIGEITDKIRGLGLPVYNLCGNHDDLGLPDIPGRDGFPADAVPPAAEDLYSALLDENPGAVVNLSRKTDYYVDFDGVRIICLSTAGTVFQPETADWLRREALDTELDVLVLSHCPTRPEWGYLEDVAGGEMIEGALREFSDRGGTVLAYLHGHDHGDMLETAEELPYTGVAIGCARFSQPRLGTEGIVYQPRNAEDETRLLFEVVLVDPQSDRVRLIRFGAGENRTVAAE